MVSSDAEPASLRAQFGNHPRARRDALLRTYVERPKQEAIEEKTGTFAETFSGVSAKYVESLVVPTGLEPEQADRDEEPISLETA